MNRYTLCFFSALFAAVVLGDPLDSQAATTIIDHTRTDITELTVADILNAKSRLHIAYGHTSHGSQITDGMTGLVGFANGGGKGLDLPDNIFAWNNGGSGGALDLEEGDGYGSGWLDHDCGYYPNWVNETRTYLNDASHADVNVLVWSWCGQAAGYSAETMINQYLAPMSQLETEYPGVKFVYMTCHLDGSGVDGQLNQRNQQIRNYCLANNKILYDFADIESYDPDGLVNYMALSANDNCDYDSDGNGSRDKNWAELWQASHTQNVDWYSCSCAHSKSLNGNQKAYAAWALWTDLATSAWKGPGGGDFNLAANWSYNAVPNGPGVTASLPDAIAAPASIAVNDPVTLGKLNFNSAQSYTLTGTGRLTLDNGGNDASINLVAGNHSIDVPVELNSDALVGGSGSLDLSGGISGDHALTVLGTLSASGIQVKSLTIGAANGVRVVPEPSTSTLLGLGVLVLIIRIGRRTQKTS